VIPAPTEHGCSVNWNGSQSTIQNQKEEGKFIAGEGNCFLVKNVTSKNNYKTEA
jgi:hypothetical protein